MYINKCTLVWAKRITTCMNTYMYIEYMTCFIRVLSFFNINVTIHVNF